MDVEPINTKRIYQGVVSQFVDFIRAGKLRTGDKCPSERSLSELFGVSRASIREAFSAMEIIGLIEVRHGEGAYVRDMHLEPFLQAVSPLLAGKDGGEEELLDFRSMLEREAVRQIALHRRMKPEDQQAGMDLLEACLDVMARAVSAGDAAAGSEADIRFHKTLFMLTGNTLLKKASECVSWLLEQSVLSNRARILQVQGNGVVLVEQHCRIFEAIADGDPGAAEAAMAEHLAYVRLMKERDLT